MSQSGTVIRRAFTANQSLLLDAGRVLTPLILVAGIAMCVLPTAQCGAVCSVGPARYVKINCLRVKSLTAAGTVE